MSPAALLIMTTLVAAPATPPPDAASLLAAVTRAKGALQGFEALWGLDAASVEWVLAGDGAAWITRDGALEPVELPAGTLRANTAVELGGRRVAMVVLPLRGPERETTVLLVHEAVHTFQPPLPSGGAEVEGPGGDLLDGEAGRTWLFLELRALAAALETEGEARREAAWDALRFRARRDALATPEERARLDALDLAEGLPEYTGWRLAGASDSEVAARMRAARAETSWVRAVAYQTGPGYGFLLDALAADGWRARARERPRLPALLEAAVGRPPPASVEARGRLYGLDHLRRFERTRTRERARRLADLRARFVDGRVLRIVPGALQLVFDPRAQVPFGEAGTFMGGVSWSSVDGARLTAPSGALVSPRWDFLQVPLGEARFPPGTVSEPRTVQGEGWTLTLTPGWRVIRSGRRVELRPPG